MRKLVALVFVLACVLGLVSCANIPDEINIDGNIYVATVNKAPSLDIEVTHS